MRLTINTGEFKEMVAKATKGASIDNNILLTQLMGIELKNNRLTLVTTDTSNYLYVHKDKVAGDDFYAVVPVQRFSKLISKLTCENVSLAVELDGNGEPDKLLVHGNGKYVLELPYDEDGELIEFPDPVDERKDLDNWSTSEILLPTVRMLLTTAKASLLQAKDKTIPYTGYYIGDRAVTTNSFKICGIDVQMFDEPKLLSAETVNLLDVVTEENIKVSYNDEYIMFVTDSVTIFGRLKEGIEDFDIASISALLDEPFPSACKVDKSALLQMLDRLALFVGAQDKNGVYLTFTKEGLNVSSKQNVGDELIPYIESQDFNDYTCCVDITMFTTQVKANTAAVIGILYGKDSTIKLVDGNIKQIVALADDDR